MHKILLEENAKTSIEHRKRLNPVMKEIVIKEVLKWLNAGFIYAISDSPWESPVHVVPKKGGEGTQLEFPFLNSGDPPGTPTVSFKPF